jgi:anaerobic ribonucleoside-triphosphate reductase
MGETYRCIHCGKMSLAKDWLEGGLVCPECGWADDCPKYEHELQAVDEVEDDGGEGDQ